jgi:nifR3 family TIM-barrel protein
MPDYSFWSNVKKNKPFTALAPMADVTDIAFRQMIVKYGKNIIASARRGKGGPTLLWTEFISADGLASKDGKKALIKNLAFNENERPIIAQIFGANPSTIRTAAALVKKLGFDGVDINMGCPDKAVVRQGAGSALIKNPKLARLIIRAAKEGAGDMPVSVKTRIGFHTNELETWLPELLAENPAAVTVHARTKKDLSLVPAKWEMVKRAVEIRNMLKSKTLIIGNGDVKNLAEVIQRAKETGADGIMIGRGFFGTPWLLNSTMKSISLDGRLQILIEHTALFEKLLVKKHIKNFAVMKKHFKAYVNGFEGAKELRVKLMEEGNTAHKVKKIIGTALGK